MTYSAISAVLSWRGFCRCNRLLSQAHSLLQYWCRKSVACCDAISVGTKRYMGRCFCRLLCTQIQISSTLSPSRALALLLVLNSPDPFITAIICYHKLIVYSNTNAVRLLSVMIRSLFKGRDMWRARLLVLNTCDAVFVTVAICYHRLTVCSSTDTVRLSSIVIRSLSKGRGMWRECY